MNLRQNQKGFTIVELLIVVVVIAILAAISIVAYTGITARANTSAALEAANSVKSVATAYNGSNGAWPTTKALFVSGGSDALAKLPNDISFDVATAYGTGTPGATAVARVLTFTDPKTVLVYPCGTTGMRIFYKNFSTNAAAYMDAGDCTTPPGTAVNSLT